MAAKANVVYYEDEEDSVLILGEHNKHLKRMYLDMYKELIEICQEYDSLLDLTDSSGIRVVGIPRKGRSKIRKLYGDKCIYSRIESDVFFKGG